MIVPVAGCSMVASFLNLRFLPDISSATVRRLGNCLFKMRLVDYGTSHFADDRQPHHVFGKVASATAEVRIHLAEIFAGRDELKKISRRHRHCAADFVPRCEAVQPDGAFNVCRLHERTSAARIALFLMKRNPSEGYVRRIGIPCLFCCDHIRILAISHLCLETLFWCNIAAAPRGRGILRWPRTKKSPCPVPAHSAFEKRHVFRGQLGWNYGSDKSRETGLGMWLSGGIRILQKADFRNPHHQIASFSGTESGTEISRRGPQKTAKPIEMTGIRW